MLVEKQYASSTVILKALFSKFLHFHFDILMYHSFFDVLEDNTVPESDSKSVHLFLITLVCFSIF